MTKLEHYLDTIEKLKGMIEEAYKACKSEAMGCPWCSGYISSFREEHDEYCEYIKMKAKDNEYSKES